MSADIHSPAHADHHDHAHDDHHHDEHDHGSLKSYLIGFGLSVVLTAIPFALVMTGALSTATTAMLVVAFAVAQILVHMVFFLHMNNKSEGGWIMLSLIFTIIIVVIAISGSLWVMHHLNVNMMPVHDMPAMSSPPVSTPAASS